VSTIVSGRHRHAIAAPSEDDFPGRLRSFSPRSLNRRLQRFRKFVDSDGLSEIAEESGVQSLVDIALHGVRAEGYNRYMGRCRIFPQEKHRLDSTDSRQIDVHQNDIRQLPLRECHA